MVLDVVELVVVVVGGVPVTGSVIASVHSPWDLIFIKVVPSGTVVTYPACRDVLETFDWNGIVEHVIVGNVPVQVNSSKGPVSVPAMVSVITIVCGIIGYF